MMIDIKDYNKILIVQTAFIGDVALTFPLVQQIKDHNPNAEIAFVTTKLSSTLAVVVDSIDRVIAYDKRGSQKGISGIKDIIKQINLFEPDVIITPHRSFRSTIISRLSKKRISIGFKHSSMPFLYDHKIPYSPNTHEISRNFTLLRPFGIIDFPSLSNLDIPITIPDQEKMIISELLKENGIENSDKYILIAPGSVWETKKWGDSKFLELTKLIEDNGIKVVLTGSNAEFETCEYIAENSNAVSLAGKSSLVGFLDLIDRAEIVVSNDSSPTHLAELMGKNVITIYGPTVPEFGFAPRLNGSEYIQVDDLKCKPCASHGSDSCPEGDHACMVNIKADDVFKKLNKLLD